MSDDSLCDFQRQRKAQGGLNLASNELHGVSDAETDEAIEFCKKMIPHNELIGRVLRNMYARLQVLEKECASLKDELQQLKLKKGKARE